VKGSSHCGARRDPVAAKGIVGSGPADESFGDNVIAADDVPETAGQRASGRFCVGRSAILDAAFCALLAATSKSGAHSHWVRSQVERRKGVDIAEALAVDGETAASSARYRPSFRGWP
jgi:hypothetical protein